MAIIATWAIYNPPQKLLGMTNNVGLTLSVGDTTLQFTISIEQDNKNCDTKYHI